MEGEDLSHFGDGARLVDDEAGDRRRLLVRQLPAHDAVQIADRHRAFDGDGAVRILTHTEGDGVVFVGNVADDFFEDILERDETEDDAIFIDDEREVNLALQKGLKLVLQACRVGHIPGIEHDILDLHTGNVAA